jgi:hypothetical protein
MTTRIEGSATSSTQWEELTAEAQRDRRREPRLKLPFQVEVYSFDRQGRYFTERTVTLNVSSGGCMLELKHQPEDEGVLAIRRVARDGTRSAEHKPVLFLVCWSHKMHRHWIVGVSKLQSGDMWGLSMPQEHTGN